jgi:polar amino acid transport system substrate-binding protein
MLKKAYLCDERLGSDTGFVMPGSPNCVHLLNRKRFPMKKCNDVSIVVMMAAMIILVACGTGPIVQPDSLLADIKQRGYILVSTDVDYEPQSWLNPEGKRSPDTKCPVDALTTAEMQGFDVDVAKAIGDSLDVETCFSIPGWDRVVAGRWADNWDISVGSMSITTERQQLFDFSVPYYYSPAVVAVRANAGFASLDDLSGQALCVGEATTYEAWLNQEDLGPTITVIAKVPDHISVVSLDTDQRCPKGITAGREDFIGYVTSETVVNANIVEGMPVVKLNGPIFYEQLAAALDKESSLSTESLRSEVDKLFAKMHSDGSLTDLSKKWFQDENGEGRDYTKIPE